MVRCQKFPAATNRQTEVTKVTMTQQKGKKTLYMKFILIRQRLHGISGGKKVKEPTLGSKERN